MVLACDGESNLAINVPSSLYTFTARVFLMDEMQNLFKYANRFDNEENNKPYTTVINNLVTFK